MATTNPVTIRLDRELHWAANAIARATGGTFREIVETGLRSEVDRRLKDGGLAEVVRVLRGYEAKKRTESNS